LSIIRGEYSYGGSSGLFEIAPINKDGELDGKVLGIVDNDVEGWLTKEYVIERIKKIANLY